MLVPFVVLVLLVAGIAAIYLLLKNMGQDGVEVAAPGSCKSGKCGVQSCATTEGTCHSENDQVAAAEGVEGMPAPERQHAVAQQDGSRPG